MDEFGLIDEIVSTLGDEASASWIEVRSGDDAAVVALSEGHSAVASIDAFLPGVHFPQDSPPEDVGYRVFMASVSDLAAMAATPRYALVALALPELDREYVLGLCAGMARAARRCNMVICGGNLARGPLNITISVHGEVVSGHSVQRGGAQVGDLVQVSGVLGQAAACVRTAAFADPGALRDAYFYPRARVDLAATLQRQARAAIDISDGCVQDLGHVVKASDVGAQISTDLIPVGEGADLDDALWGGDDYELLVTARLPIDGFTVIGEIASGQGVSVDGEPVTARGYDHFRA